VITVPLLPRVLVAVHPSEETTWIHEFLGIGGLHEDGTAPSRVS
jgi:hypothetical protein